MAQEHPAGSTETLCRDGVLCGNIADQQLHMVGGLDAGVVVNVIDGDRYAMKDATVLAGLQFGIGLLRILQRTIRSRAKWVTSKGGRVANQIEAGRVFINDAPHDPPAPFGGFRQSGFGREFGVLGLEAFLEPRAVAVFG